MEIHLLRTFITFVLHSYLLGSFDTTKKRERRGFSYIVTQKKTASRAVRYATVITISLSLFLFYKELVLI